VQLVVKYADFGCATARRRLILAGFLRQNRTENRAVLFVKRLEAMKKPAATVREKLDLLLHLSAEEDPDHVWLNFRTIHRYADKYREGKFGWYRLNPDRPAPSFGNISKTYILHPYAGNGHGVPLRVLSVREAMTIMGFPLSFRFPPGMGITTRYQMVADTVSPEFSEICAAVIRELICS